MTVYPYLGGRLRQMSYSYYFMTKWLELYPENFYVLVYDRLLKNSEHEMKSLTKFLEISYHPTLLTTTKFHGKELKRQGWSAKSDRHSSGDIQQIPLNAWKDQITSGALKLVNQHFIDIIEDFGFDSFSLDFDTSQHIHPKEDKETAEANNWLFSQYAGMLI